MSITEYIIPNLEFFSDDPLNLSIEDNEYLEVSSINPIEQNDVVEFRCLSQPMTFKSLSEIYLKAEVQILKSDSSLYTDADLIQPPFANNALFSMIKSASVYLNNVQVVNLNETFAQKHIIESYCNIDKMSCKSRFICQGLFQPEKNRLAKGWMISYQFKSGEVTSFSIPSSSTNYVAQAVLLSYKPS